MKNHNVGFNNSIYLKNQVAAIKKIIGQSREKLYIEFGGKIINDKHAARVLPGYDEDAKAKLIKILCHTGEIIFVISAKDIIRGRVRGDFKITYDKEALRVLSELKKHQIYVKHVAIAMNDKESTKNKKIIDLKKILKKMQITIYDFYSTKDYYSTQNDFNDLNSNPFIKTDKKIVIILSPGGGSGKFGICLSQLYHEMRKGVSPHYLKFETFPVHDFPLSHPLNLAYMAASADFYDQVMLDKRHGSATSYNRDIKNYELLHVLSNNNPRFGKYLKKLSSATYMGVNKVSTGIVNDEIVQREAAAEIARRLIRYKFEVANGEEDKKILNRVRKILKLL
ncbi:MAG: DUF1846 family protein [bacterium]|nr:DUF1846 family protein [bacterium]